MGSLSDGEIRALVDHYGFGGFVATSAKTGEGVDQLRTLLQDNIRWDELPVTHSPKLSRNLKEFIVTRWGEAPLTRCSDLKIAFRLAARESEIGDRAFDTVIEHLQSQGLVWRLSFGDLILLRPELLNDYASAVVLAAHRHPKGLGCVAERDVLNARIDLSALKRIPDKEAERSLLHAVVERFIDREIDVRENSWCFPPNLTCPSR